jgi:predicted GNAT family acetyltransferase
VIMLRTKSGLRVLGPDDLPEVLALLSADPVCNVFVEYRARQTKLNPRWLGGEVWGYSSDGELRALCHAGANLVPVNADSDALDTFATRAATKGRSCSSIVGLSDQVAELWSRLRWHWGPARLVREAQPFMKIDRPPLVEADPAVRPVRKDEIDILYPAAVAMFTEEVGVSPEASSGRGQYESGVRQLVERELALARIEHDQVVFKAEIGAVTPSACQVQGVWVDPQLRGRGLAAPGMAAVVDYALRRVAPVVTLYVNEHNQSARRAYQRVGFAEVARFNTVLF